MTAYEMQTSGLFRKICSYNCGFDSVNVIALMYSFVFGCHWHLCMLVWASMLCQALVIPLTNSRKYADNLTKSHNENTSCRHLSSDFLKRVLLLSNYYLSNVYPHSLPTCCQTKMMYWKSH